MVEENISNVKKFTIVFNKNIVFIINLKLMLILFFIIM